MKDQNTIAGPRACKGKDQETSLVPPTQGSAQPLLMTDPTPCVASSYYLPPPGPEEEVLVSLPTNEARKGQETDSFLKSFPTF